MPTPGSLPRIGAQLVDARGFITPEWRDFLTGLAGDASVSGLAAALAALAVRVAELEQDEAGNFIIQGFGSINVAGTPHNGVVQLSLLGDEPAPGVTYLYGTGPDGVKGWHRLYDAMAAGVGLVITDSGYVVLGEVETPSDLPGSGNTGEAWRVLDESPGLYAWDGAAFALAPDADGVVGFRLSANLDDLLDVDTSGAAPGDALVFDGAIWAPGRAATEQLFQRMDTNGDFRITADGNLRVTN